MTGYLCLQHHARRLDEAELATAKAEQTAVCSATSSCVDLIAYAVCWRYTDRTGGQEWMGATLVCTRHAEAFATHHGLDLTGPGVTPAQISHPLGGNS